MRVAWPVVSVALVSLSLAGCLGSPEPEPASAPVIVPPVEAPAPPSLRLEACRGGLHVWLLPLDQLRQHVPAGYTVEPYERDGVPTGMGRLGLYFLRCGGEDGLRTQSHGAVPMLGLLGVKLAGPSADGGSADPGLPAGALPFYAVQVYVQQHDLEAALRASPFPVLTAEHGDSFQALPVVELPTYASEFTAEDGSRFRAEMRAAPPQPEAYARLVRAYYEGSDGALGVLDLNLTASLWESAGTYEASEDSAVMRVVGGPAAVADHHILVGVEATVTAWTAQPEDHGEHGMAAPPALLGGHRHDG